MVILNDEPIAALFTAAVSPPAFIVVAAAFIVINAPDAGMVHIVVITVVDHVVK
jgi:hypothetical protein